MQSQCLMGALGALRLLRSSRVALTQPDACGAGESRATTNLGRAANRAMRDLNRRLAGRASGFAWPAARSPLQPCGLSPPAKTRMPHTRHTIMYCVKGVNQKSFSGSKAVAVRTPVRTSSCQSLFLESSAAGCPPGGRALQGGPAVLGRVAASAITVWKSAL